ncbi:Fe-S cluster assembly protein SufD [Marinagarivorans algicola]|uniref:Fe-S cluster assembly protein SufD n=1 Tax=Marinagarivorans algicola TaxID=1513270 RepID=UPI0006B4313B|nr:Fe-S cluster assembly protein SufD [Marinagarivorans algicola]
MTSTPLHAAIAAGSTLNSRTATSHATTKIADMQNAAAHAWAQTPWPTRTTEAWKYTPLKALEKGEHFTPAAKNTLTSDALKPFEINRLEALTLVFIDGHFCAEQSDDLTQLPTGMTIEHLSDASDLGQFNKAAGEHATLFGELNTASIDAALVISVAKNAQVIQPVRVLNIASANKPCLANARILWQQAPHSKATLVEHFVSTQGSHTFTNSITELFVGENAECEHYRLHLEDEANLHIGGVYSHVHKHARLNSFYLAMGANLQRVDVVTQFEGEGAEAVNNGVYLPRNKQLVDFHTCIEHKVPHCNSHETFRGIIGDSARAVFNGRIHIHKDAQKTLAELSNKNLLTSNKAEVNTKPELEIYADDVRCAHGATIAELDALAMHYLRTRGIGQAEAQVMLSFGFINELIEQLNNAAIVEYLRPVIAQRFANKSELLDSLTNNALI